MGTEITTLQTMAAAVTKSGMFGLKNENQALTLMLISEAEGIAPIQAVQMYSVINGVPSLKSTEVQARFQRSGGKVQWIETTDKKAVAKMTHETAGEYTSEFTIEQAIKMGLANKDNWVKMPKQMLMARCITSGVRALYPACLNNMYSVEEMMDNVLPESEVVIDIEIEEEVNLENEHTNNKKKLRDKLAKLSFSKADMTAFAKEFDLNDKELVESLVCDDSVLLEAVEKFENNTNKGK